jgi:hypothetical protein
VKQIIIAKNPSIKQLSGSRIKFFQVQNDDTKVLVLECGKPKRVTIPFSVKILSGGTLDLDFKISQDLAAAGVSLLGAYWNGEQVTAYLMPLQDTEVHVPSTIPILEGTLVQVTTYRQVEERVMGAKAVFEGGVLRLDKKVERKRRRKNT